MEKGIKPIEKTLHLPKTIASEFLFKDLVCRDVCDSICAAKN